MSTLLGLVEWFLHKDCSIPLTQGSLGRPAESVGKTDLEHRLAAGSSTNGNLKFSATPGTCKQNFGMMGWSDLSLARASHSDLTAPLKTVGKGTLGGG